jgi:hypothetical protein
VSRRATAILALAALGSGCAIDTELGLAVDVRAATVAVLADPAGDVVTTALELQYRTGAHAGEAHELRPQSIEVFTVDETRVVGISPDRPPVFVPRVGPGESRQVTLTGRSDPGEATDARRLCGQPAVVLFRWVDVTTGEIGMSEATSGPAACD